MSNKLIAPSILSANFAKLGEEIVTLEQAGADWIHVDVMDGHFVPNLTIGPVVISSLRPVTKLPFDVHLMIDQPEKWIPEYLKAGADYVTFHIEATQVPEKCFELIKSASRKSGITLKPGTELEKIEPYLHLVDLVLVMTVEPGFGGQKFMQDQVQKITKLKELRSKHAYQYLIEVDGGVNQASRPLLNEVDVFVAGSYVFSGDYRERMNSLR